MRFVCVKCLLRPVVGRRARKSELVLVGRLCLSDPRVPPGKAWRELAGDWASEERRVVEVLGKGRCRDCDGGQNKASRPGREVDSSSGLSLPWCMS